MLHALMAAVALGMVMTLGDFLWEAFHIRHRMLNGLIHGATMCLCIGIAIGMRTRRAAVAAPAGLVIGVIAAASFYALSPRLGWGAMFPAWMLFWVLFALLQQRLRRNEPIGAAFVRGAVAAVLSGIAFYLISDIWIHESRYPGIALRLAAWTFAFLPGFAALFYGARAGRGHHAD
jgi:hypothetical protein